MLLARRNGTSIEQELLAGGSIDADSSNASLARASASLSFGNRQFPCQRRQGTRQPAPAGSQHPAKLY